MSFLFSRALVEEFLQGSCSDGARSALSSGNPTPQAFLSPDKMTDFSRPSRFGMTFAPLTDGLGEELLTWFLGASPARTFPLQEPVGGLMASGPDSGQKWRGSLAKYSPDSRSWKTAQRSLLGGLDEFSETWPRWGTTVAGELYLLPTPALHIDASASGLWPTPTASDNRDRGNMSDPAIQRRIRLGKQVGLSMAVKSGPQAGSLNPTWVEWLMGWPLGWTDLKPLETGKSQSPQSLRGAD